jgi:hypothetical protein
LTKWWESEFIKVLAHHEVEAEGLQLFFQAFRSFVDITSESVLGDTLLLGVGYVIVYFYIIMVLGKCNQVEQRVSTRNIISIFYPVSSLWLVI